MNKSMVPMRRRAVSNGTSIFCSAAALVTGMWLPALAQGETRGFVVSALRIATHYDPVNCPRGGNGAQGAIVGRALDAIFSEAERRQFIGLPDFLGALLAMRGQRDGKLANIYHYPDSTPDPHHEIVAGAHAYGFDLDGHSDGEDFQDPQTQAGGVDNQLFRAIGCYANFNLSPPDRPYNMVQGYTFKRLGAWLLEVSAEDLARDGNATVSFSRAIGHLRLTAVGTGLPDVTYTIDPSGRTQGECRGRIQNGVLSCEMSDAGLSLEGEQLLPTIELQRARMRLVLHPGGLIDAYLGGFQPWRDIWFFNAGEEGGPGAVDSHGLFYNLKRLADADPDPTTGANRAISATYQLEAIPAFIARSDGTIAARNQ